MIRQCCSTFTHHLPAVENTWRPRWEDESYETYRHRIVDKGDGDLFQGMQILERALQGRVQALIRLARGPGLQAHVGELMDQADALQLERRHVPPRTFALHPAAAAGLRVGACERCRCVWAQPVLAGESASDAPQLCDICREVDRATAAWAPQMPTKAVKATKKKRRKKKKRALPAAPSHADLHRLMQEQPALRQKILGQARLAQAHGPDTREWVSPFEDAYLRWEDEEL